MEMVETTDASHAAVCTVHKNGEPGKMLLQFLSVVITVVVLDCAYSQITSTVLITSEDGSANLVTLALVG